MYKSVGRATIRQLRVSNYHQLRFASSQSPCTSYIQVTHPETEVPAELQNRVNDLQKYTVNTYSRPPIIFTHGKGCKIWDSDNREYLDMTAGIAVNALGHSDAGVINAITEQANKLMHNSNVFMNEWSGQLAKLLVESTVRHGGLGFSPASPVSDSESQLKAFFANSGTEANEAALKFARKAAKTSPSKVEIVCFSGAFHGRTFGALSATAQEKYQAPFAPLVPGFKTGRYNNIEDVHKLVDSNTCGVILEPIQGEGGIASASEGFLRALRKRCDEVGAVLIYDEIQCGLGRTGKLWAHSAFGVDCHPDIVTMAKPLANGIPIGAVLTRNWVADAIKIGDHGTTFGGAPLQCRVAHHVVTQISNQNFLSQVQQKGNHLTNRLERLRSFFPNLITAPIRGRGLIQGLPMATDELPGRVISLARERGVLLLTCGNKTVRLVPSLIVETEEIDKTVDVLESCLSIIEKE